MARDGIEPQVVVALLTQPTGVDMVLEGLATLQALTTHLWPHSLRRHLQPAAHQQPHPTVSLGSTRHRCRSSSVRRHGAAAGQANQAGCQGQPHRMG